MALRTAANDLFTVAGATSFNWLVVNLDSSSGVITDRDVCCRATADGYDPKRTAIKRYITRKLITCLPDDELEHCLELLHKHGSHRVPVVDDESRCIGIVASSDAPDRPETVVRREFARAVRSNLKKHNLA